MPRDSSQLLETVETALAEQNVELAETRARQLRSVFSHGATGSGDMDETFSLDRKYRLVFIRCHFGGGSGTAAFKISVDSAKGSAYDTRLFTITQAGTDKDVHLRITDGEPADPSPWTFQDGDKIRIEWTNPDSGNMTWGLEVGLALAS